MGPANAPGAATLRTAVRQRGVAALAAAMLWLALVVAGGVGGAYAQQGAAPPDAAGVLKVPLTALDAVPGNHDEDDEHPVGRHKDAPDKVEPPLPAEVVSRHSLALPDRTLSFTAKVGAIGFEDDKGTTVAEMGYFAYLLDGTESKTRPVTFVINGGPGSASAWLQLGALGPWRASLERASAIPTAPADLKPNADTWLDFTDLVFIDPVGTGFTRLGSKDKGIRRKFWSTTGDIDSIAVLIKRWLEANGRVDSPKFYVGESYGGFRGPRVAATLQKMPGLALNGMVLVSPALARLNTPGFGPAMSRATAFPSLAAAVAAGKGPVSAEQLAAFEREAVTGYLPDALAGPRDREAVERLAARMAAVTGLDVATVRQIGPRASPGTFLAAIDRGSGVVSSYYDGTEKRIAAYDGPERIEGGDDLGALAFHLERAMTSLVQGQLGWKTTRPYLALNRAVRWSWESHESVTPLRSALVRDPTFRVLIAHGYADLVTPYFRTKLILQQLPTVGPDNSRIRLAVYPGGHMLYTNDASRAQLRKDALALYAATGAVR